MSSPSNPPGSGAAAPSSFPRLGPAWHRGAGQGGRGFQPPPAVPDGRAGGGRERSGSTISTGSDKKEGGSSRNSFSALLDDEEGTGGGTRDAANGPRHDEGARRSVGDRFERLRSSSGGGSSSAFNRGSLPGSGAPPGGVKPTGRSLADLAARAPAPTGIGRSRTEDGGAGRHSSFRGDTSGDSGGKVIRYTREKLLSLRPPPKPDAENPPPNLRHLEGMIVLAKGPQDPVCWDTFDAEEIWAQAARERPRGGIGAGPKGPPGTGTSLRSRDALDGEEVRRSAPSGGGGKWQRGVALPPADDHLSRRGVGRAGGIEAENPEDLWDDPSAGGSMAAAPDFSQFGGSLDDGRPARGGSMGSSGFDLSDMSEAARRFEEELHGSKRRPSDSDGDEGSPTSHTMRVDPHRPLASTGTTIRSGSGDDVNVFEDFAEPGSESATPSEPTSGAEGDSAIKAGEAMSASSRLMQMIGVSPDATQDDGVSGSSDLKPTTVSSAENVSEEQPEPDVKQAEPASSGRMGTTLPRSSSSSVPSNPWGDPIGGDVSSQEENQTESIDLSARLEAAVAEQKARDAQAAAEQRQREEAEMQAKRQAQQQAEAQARQQQAASMQGQQQQQSGHSQVELVLMERISAILENSWGRSDLMSILSTLHAEDSRVIPLLGSTDALRALIARHPRRVGLAMDPALGAEMAVLVITNAQWQQQQQAQAQQEELRRQRQLQEQQQLQAAQQAAAARARAEAEERAKAEEQKRLRQKVVVTDAPWFYADPQGNIQGPFGGEEMRQWLEAGYFKGDLPISQNPNGQFRALSTLFPDPGIAFQPTAPSAEEEQAKVAAEQEKSAKAAAALAEQKRREKEEAEAKARAQAEAEARARAENEARAKAQAEAQAKAQAQALAEAQATAQAQAEASDPNASSAQLKMLLGLGGSSSNQSQPGIESQEEAVFAGPPQKAKGVAAQPPPPQQQLPPSRSSAKQQGAKSNKSQQRAPPAPEPALAPTPTSAWGGAAAAGKTIGRKKSMSEIQQEEARAAARMAKDRQSVPRSSSGGWANIAASGGGSTGWSSGAVKPSIPVAPAGPTPAVTTPPTSANATTGMKQVRAKQQAQVAAAQKQTQQRTSTQQKPVDDFGASEKMSPALENWCKEQMRKLSGSDDLTLVAFCMTLTDSIEIRQYLTAYLGSTPQVNNFATEFIKRKGGSNGKQEEWESAGSSKKGRKKKGSSR